MKLADLNPRFVDHGGDGITRNDKPVPRSEGVGLSCDCPCGSKECVRLYVDFENPINPAPGYSTNHPRWKRTGDQFESMTLEPSIQRMDNCNWHGWLRNGEFVTA